MYTSPFLALHGVVVSIAGLLLPIGFSTLMFLQRYTTLVDIVLSHDPGARVKRCTEQITPSCVQDTPDGPKSRQDTFNMGEIVDTDQKTNDQVPFSALAIHRSSLGPFPAPSYEISSALASSLTIKITQGNIQKHSLASFQ
jgi:hypothetical protein